MLHLPVTWYHSQYFLKPQTGSQYLSSETEGQQHFMFCLKYCSLPQSVLTGNIKIGWLLKKKLSRVVLITFTEAVNLEGFGPFLKLIMFNKPCTEIWPFLRVAQLLTYYSAFLTSIHQSIIGTMDLTGTDYQKLALFSKVHLIDGNDYGSSWIILLGCSFNYTGVRYLGMCNQLQESKLL